MILLAFVIVLGGPNPLATKCKAGDAAACVKLAERVVATSDPGEDDDAADWYSAACDLGDAAACVSGATWALSRQGHLPGYARDLGQKACGLGRAEGCVVAGTWLERGVAEDGDKPRPAEALAAFERACELRSQRGCAEVARMLRENRQTPADLARAKRLWRAACAAGEQSACVAEARAALDGFGGPRDRARALAILDAACDAAGKASASPCLWASYVRALGTAPEAAARDRVLAACPRGAGDAEACWLRLQLVRARRAQLPEGEPLELARRRPPATRRPSRAGAWRPRSWWSAARRCRGTRWTRPRGRSSARAIAATTTRAPGSAARSSRGGRAGRRPAARGARSCARRARAGRPRGARAGACSRPLAPARRRTRRARSRRSPPPATAASRGRATSS
ncbi:MAG: sel1 repeat family protein [Deltaproteobacteria bacterium]|nr:sel1 repeat family protein [Deltaproteobacteria bacterium]